MNRHPLKLTQLMLFARREPITRTPAEVGLRLRATSRSRPVTAWASRAGSSRRTARAPRRRSCSCTAGCGTGSATSPARRRSTTATWTSCPPPRRCTTRAFTCCCTTSAARRERGRHGLRHLRPAREARLRRRGQLPALARRRRRRADRRARHLDGRHDRALRRARVPADQGHPGRPAGQGHDFNANFCARPVRPLGTPLLAGPVELLYRIWRSPPPSGQDPGAPGEGARRHDRPLRPGHRATSGARWTTSSRIRGGHADPRRAGRAATPRPAATTATATCPSAATRSSTSSCGPCRRLVRRRHLRAQERVEGGVGQQPCASS